MYVGHVGIALGAKGWRRGVPLWVLVLAAQACDWADVLVMRGGAPRVSELVPEMWTHSVPAVLGMAAAFGVAYWVARRSTRDALFVGAVVVSHVVVDYITGYKPTWPGGPVIGLGLYGRPAWDFVVEGAVIVLGWLVYVRTLPSGSGRRRPAWVMLASLLVLQLLAEGAFQYEETGGARRARVARVTQGTHGAYGTTHGARVDGGGLSGRGVRG